MSNARKKLADAGLYHEPPKNPVGAVSVDPDVIRATQMFGKWTTNVLADSIKNGASAEKAALLDKIAGIPTHNAVPYDYTEHMLMQNLKHGMKSKWDDAYRLQYYAQNRTMLERTINHPMFGIYPASYMWGKMIPEITRFMAQTPFGLRTGAAAYTFRDVQMAVAAQHEWDTTFNDNIDKLGHSASMYAIGYMMPTNPWEAGAAWPAWIREFGQEGLDMQARVEGGQSVATDASGMGINVPQVYGKATNLLNPLRTLDMAVFAPIEEITNPKKNPVPEGNPYGFHGGQPVAGQDLGNPLTDALGELKKLFGG